MKTGKNLLFLSIALSMMASCSVLSKPKYGCPANGKNVGAEKLLSDPNAGRKAKKFRA